MAVADARRRWQTLGIRLLIAFGAVWVLANASATVWRLRSPVYNWHVHADYDGKTRAITPCGATIGPADASSALDLRRTDRATLVRLLGGVGSDPRPLEVFYDGRTQPDTLPATVESLCARGTTMALRSLGAIAMFVLGAILLWRIRSLPVLGFFLFVLGFSPMTQTSLNAFLPADGLLVQNLLNDVFEGAGLLGMILFSDGLGERVYHVDVHSAANVAIRWVIGAIAVVATAGGVLADVRFEILREPASAPFMVSQILVAIGVLLVIALLFSTYFASDSKTRARMRWICLSFAVGIPLYLVGYVSDNVPFVPLPDVCVDLLYLAIVLVPAAVAYAMLRDHVMDAGLFVSRGGVYAAVVFLIIVALEALMEWAKPVLEDLPVVTIVAAFFVVSFHPVTEWAKKRLEGWLAKDRIRALRELLRSSGKFALCDSFADLEKLMVHSAAASLQLTGAALVSGDRLIEGTQTYEQHAGALKALANDVALREELEATTGAVRLPRAKYADTLREFHDDVVPLAAIALENPGLPFHVFVAGPHLDGTDLDREELDALERFVERGLVAHLVLAVREIERRIGMPGSPLTEPGR